MWSARSITFVNAAVIAPDGVACTLRVRGGTIDGIGVAPDRRDTVVDLNAAVVLPGLINAHDHLELNSFRRLKWRERYANAREWIADFQPRFAADPDLADARPETLADRVWVGALKNLLAGVSTVCHHNPLHKPLTRRFPVRVVRRFGLSHSLLIDGQQLAEAYRRTPADWPWIVHAAEGVDAEAAREVDVLRELGCLGRNTVLVHGVALTPQSSDEILSRGGSLVWCPTSNQFLFGRTADVRRFDDAGALALGTDSRLSGEGDLLDELRAAHATRQISPGSLVRSVTSAGADVLRLPQAGRLVRGAPADITVLRRLAPSPDESVVMASRGDIRLTMIDGRPLVAEPELSPVFEWAREKCADARVDGSARLLASWVARRAAGLRLREPGLEVAAC